MRLPGRCSAGLRQRLLHKSLPANFNALVLDAEALVALVDAGHNPVPDVSIGHGRKSMLPGKLLASFGHIEFADIVLHQINYAECR